MANLDREQQERKSAENRAYLEELSQSAWERMMGYNPRRKFQKGELTTGQAGEIYKRTAATIRVYCELGLIPGAYRDEGGWWHIPASGLEEINMFMEQEGLEWTMQYWIRYYGSIRIKS